MRGNPAHKLWLDADRHDSGRGAAKWSLLQSRCLRRVARVESTWLTRELPVLHAVVTAEQAGEDPQAAARASVSHLSEAEFLNCLDRLGKDGFLDVAVLRGDGGLLSAHVRRAHPKALREVGLWPPAATPLEEKKLRRLSFVERLYRQTGGDTMAMVEISEVGAELGWSEEEARSVARYLAEEGLLKFPAKGGVAMTHAGVVEMETALENPRAPTVHFPALNVVNIYGDVTGSQIQAGAETSNQYRTVGDGE